MKDLKSFLKGNAEERKNVFVAVSERFKDDTGNPIEWEVKALSAEEDEQIRKSCFVPVTGQKSGNQERFDTNAYMLKVAAACTVFPDLHNAELQDSYGVHTATDLLKKLLYAGELNNYLEVIEKQNGYGKKLEEQIEKVKN